MTTTPAGQLPEVGFHPQEAEIGRVGPVGEAEVRKAAQTLSEYKQSKTNLEARIISNEQWYRMRHWQEIGQSSNKGDPQPASAWLLNTILNKHADAMDNYPKPNVLPREAGDTGDAELLTSILPVLLEQNEFEQTYSDMWWYKLKAGTGVIKVTWDTAKRNGIGDIGIVRVDLLNLFWEPGITDVQKSRNLFHVELVDRDVAEEQWPFLEGHLSGGSIELAKYHYDDTVDVTNKVEVVDWYYKRVVGGREILHYCKFCCGIVVYASENDPSYRGSGYYDHGKYPFVFDVMFPEEGTPVGFGYIDICKSPQMYIDKMDQVLLKHGVMGARPRFFVRGDGVVNEQEFSDWEKDFVHFHGSGNPSDSIAPIVVPGLSDTYIGLREMKINEMKETSGNRDFSQGGTASGVTAASAIAALQEAGSKLSRDMIKSSYRAFVQVNYLCIELMRQFYDAPRWFRVVGPDGEMQFMQFSSARIAPHTQGNDFGMDMGSRMPIFDIKVSSEKSSPFSQVAQNERAKEMYGMGFSGPIWRIRR